MQLKKKPVDERENGRKVINRLSGKEACWSVSAKMMFPDGSGFARIYLDMFEDMPKADAIALARKLYPKHFATGILLKHYPATPPIAPAALMQTLPGTQNTPPE